MPTDHPALAGRSLVLGSTSRYRRELLARLGLPFDVVAPEVDETPLPGEAPHPKPPIRRSNVRRND